MLLEIRSAPHSRESIHLMATIRRASESDIPEMVAVVNAAFQVERDFRDSDRTSPAETSRLMQSSTFFVAINDGRIAGAVQVRVNGTTGYFGMLAVDPTLQRSGLGRMLREAAEIYCREQGCMEMTLSTGSVRRELLSYYRKFGYEITSIEPAPEAAPFSKTIEIVRMAKPL